MAEDKRYDGEQRQEKRSLLGDAAKIGGAVGAGVAAYRNRSFLARQASNVMSEIGVTGSRMLNKNGQVSRVLSDTKIMLTGLSDALGENPSVTRTLRAGFNEDIQNNMRRNYENSVRNNIKKRQSKQNKPGQNNTEFGTRYFKEFHKREMNGLNKFEYSATKAFRENEIRMKLGGQLEVKRHGGDKIIGALDHFNIKHHGDVFNNPANHIDSFIKELEEGKYKHKVKFKDKEQKNAFQKQLLETLDAYSDMKKVHDMNKGAVGEIAQKMKTATAYGFIKDAIESTSLIGKALQKKGFKPTTLKDVEHLDDAAKQKYGLIIHDVDKKGETKKVDITKEMRKFLDEQRHNKDLQILLSQKGHSFDFSNINIDRYLFKHKQTGEVIDNRHLKDVAVESLDTFQQSVKVPFLNINPLDLTPWQTVRSGQSKEGLHVLSAGQVHGYVRNLGDQTFDDVNKVTHNNAIRNPLANSNHFYTGGNVFRFTDEKGLELIDEDLYLTPSQFGPFARMHKNQTNYSELDAPDERNWLKKLFDVGYQEDESRATTYRKAWNKLSDPKYGPNALKSMVYDLHTQDEGHTEIITDVYNIMRVGIDKSAQALSRESAEVLAPHVNKLFNHIEVGGEAFDFTRLSDDDYLKDAAVAFQKEFNKADTNLDMYTKHTRSVYTQDLSKRDTTTLYQDPSVKELTRWTQKYIKDPEGFNNSREAAVDRKLPSMFDFVVPFMGDDERLIPAADKLRRSFHQYALRALDDESGDFAPGRVANNVRQRTSLAYLIDARDKGYISHKDVKNAKDLETLTDLLSYDNIHDANASTQEAKTFLHDLMNIQEGSVGFDERKLQFEEGGVALTGLGQDLQEGILRAQPILGRAPEASEPSVNGADFIIMRKSGLSKTGKDLVSELNLKNLVDYGPLEDGWDLAINTEMYTRNAASSIWQAGKDITQELFAGRHRNSDTLENVTTSTGIMYGLAERLNNQLGNFGLSLSRQNMGSFQSIMANQYLRRVALPYIAYQQAVYFDGLTDDTVSDTLADDYVNTHETLAGIKETLGINKIMKPWANVFKQAGGFDQIGEWAGVKQLDFLSFGLFSDFRSPEELRDYYESGEDPIRKNRYWGIGSPSPWAGSGIDHFEPNWYRKVKSDYQFTDTEYGDESEYWANNWMPTLTHPLAPIKHFITDPYHYEKKHEDDRPYAVTGGFSEVQNIPIIGPAIDSTVGRILKPRLQHKGLEKAHEEYLSAINQYVQEQYSPVKDGSYVSVSGTGAVAQFNMNADPGTEDMFGGTAAVYGEDSGIVNYGNGITPTYRTQISGGIGEGSGGTAGVHDIGGPSFASGGTNTLGGSISGRGISGATKSQSQIAEQNALLAMDGDGVEARPVYQLQKLQNMTISEDLSDLDQVDSISGSVIDGFYSASELGGIYGFLTKTGMNYDESWRGTTLASSNLMTSSSRAFWDSNLGGAGGALSEIGRRYFPRDPNKDYYSPIRNTMPDWLPGIEGTEDLLHGDPYVKIQKGEMRLPGKAYEKLYKLHPDGTGAGEYANYGVFDRFRILADVDPDSDQYSVAKHQVTLLRQAGGMSEDMEKEFDQIVEQVHDKQDTIRWYDKKFSNAEIKKETVTVSKVLDANTFMVQEYDTPIKLAGVKLTKKDNQDVIDWLGQYLKPGEKVDIGVAKEAAARYNKDTYGTMSAVVYSKKNEEGRFWFESNKGQSLNAIIANRTWENKVQTKDNGDPVNTRALYSNDMVTVGKYMEMLTHDVLPKVPFVGILADKFLQVRTPIESYKRDQVYGSDWRPWQHPYEGWIKPMVNTVASQNPLLAGAEMAAIGHMFGRGMKATGLGRVAGFAIGAGLSSLRVFDETAEPLLGADGVWMPKERKKEREINEYFDRLKYVKYRGLYEEAKKLAEQKEGIDVEEFFDESAEKGEKNKGLKRFLTERKRMLSFAKKMGYGDKEAVKSQIGDLNDSLEELSAKKDTYEAGQYASLAIRYRKEYEGTLYGMSESGSTDRTALMRALTPKEREYVPRFLETTSSKERQQILKYVPEDVKRILQGSWGMKVDKQEDIEDYFSHHYVPNENWSGWAAGSNMDDIKIKVMKKEGVNPTLSGYWGKDQQRADQSGEKALPPIHSLANLLDGNRIKKLLAGAGLSDVDVQLTTHYGEGNGGINTSFHVMQDVQNEILDVINETPLSFL